MLIFEENTELGSTQQKSMLMQIYSFVELQQKRQQYANSLGKNTIEKRSKIHAI
ncbi:hypothetical protein FACS1894113_5720 [Alphaproteobacteria bacterium]|nr:hypothetical protein FACS1894113_5720 [Alphaproteobacteria bacterium]